MDKKDQTILLNGLQMEGIEDCYMWRNKLMVLNGYDKEVAELWLQRNDYRIDVCEIDSDMDSMIAYA